MLRFLTYIPSVLIIVAWALKKLFSHKKTLLTGPPSSGKTTFLKYLTKENIPNGASGAPKSYKVKHAVFDVVTDLSGAEAWLYARFDEYIKNHDFILFFFDVSEFISDKRYQLNTSARLEKLYEHLTFSQKVVLVGTHIDKVAGVLYRSEVESFFASKSYNPLLKRMVYIDTTKKKNVKLVIEELNR